MLNLSGIVENSIVDGEGIRCTVFVQGCPHHCKGCHNPTTWEFKDNIKMSVDEIVDMIKDDFLLEGITFSGGEPFTQPKDLIELADKVHAIGKTVWCFTGYTYEHLLQCNDDKTELLKHIDVLVDGRFEIDKRDISLKFRGSTNQRVIDIPASLKENNVILKY